MRIAVIAAAGVIAALLMGVAAYASSSVSGNGVSAVEKEVVKLVREVNYLESMGVNVAPLTHMLNKAVVLAEKGKVAEARSILASVNATILKLKGIAGQVHARELIFKYGSVAALLSIPVITYFLLPRAYLYAWFRSKRKWVVERMRK